MTLWYLCETDEECRGPFPSLKLAQIEIGISFQPDGDRRYKARLIVGERIREIYVVDYMTMVKDGWLGSGFPHAQKTFGASPVQADPIDILRCARYRVYKSHPHYGDHGLRGANAKYDRAYDLLDNAIRHLSGRPRKRRA